LNVLVAIKHHGGDEGLPQVQISRHLIVTKSNMTKHLDKLEREGYIARSARPGDRRVKIVKITPKAEKLLNGLWDDYNERLKQLTATMSRAKQKQLAALLTEWFGGLVEGALA
ncbi:MAG: MarR family transcriptional regulator, partial [Candidatus Omnitrophica bacterium]|nr:MarR family transcriptional regulator [Candidatus Omnitrophota bacterium]